jgi:hypothetical protein
MAAAETELSRLVQEFTIQIFRIVEQATADKIRAAVSAAIVQPSPGPGRPPKNGVVPLAVMSPLVQRKKGPKQLCPAPGCKNPAAPVFGMVCAKHRDVPKAKIKKYREARKAAKEKAK